MRGVRRGLLQRGDEHVLDLVEQDRRRPARPRLVDQPVQPPRRRTGPASGSPFPASPAVGAATSALDAPSAQASTILDRNASACAVFARRAQRVKLIPLGLGEHQLRLRRPGRSASIQPGPASAGPRNAERHLRTVSVETPKPAATPRI